jgi:cytochrome c oxidase subunit 2
VVDGARAVIRDVSLDGHVVDEALQHSLWAAAALLAFLVVWLVWALFVSRRPAGKGGAAAVAFAVAVFCAVDGPLAWASLHEQVTPAEAIRVEVNAHQWAWNFRTAGEDGVLNTPDDVVTWNELRVPAGVRVALQLGSTDVVHGFNAPALRVKTEVVPGQLSRVSFAAREPGVVEVACSQHCGPNHYRMRAEIVVMEKGDFAKWQHEASALAAIGFDPDDGEAHWGWEWAP